MAGHRKTDRALRRSLNAQTASGKSVCTAFDDEQRPLRARGAPWRTGVVPSGTRGPVEPRRRVGGICIQVHPHREPGGIRMQFDVITAIAVSAEDEASNQRFTISTL